MQPVKFGKSTIYAQTGFSSGWCPIVTTRTTCLKLNQFSSPIPFHSVWGSALQRLCAHIGTPSVDLWTTSCTGLTQLNLTCCSFLIHVIYFIFEDRWLNSVAWKFSVHQNPLGGLLKHRLLGFTKFLSKTGMEQQICISFKFPDNTGVAESGPTLEKHLCVQPHHKCLVYKVPSEQISR